MCDKHGKTREEAFTFIIDELESLGDITYSTNIQAKINKNNFLDAFIQVDKPLWEFWGYSKRGGHYKLIISMFSYDIQQYKGKFDHWDSFLLNFFDMGYCRLCDTCYDLCNFSKRSDRASGHQSVCRHCAKLANKEYTTKNRKKLLTIMIELGFITDYNCQGCGTKYSTSHHIHHKNPEELRPDYAISRSPSQYLISCSEELMKERLLVEGHNLTVLCPSCHRIEHSRLDALKEER